jgi:hypothetical protein
MSSGCQEIGFISLGLIEHITAAFYALPTSQTHTLRISTFRIEVLKYPFLFYFSKKPPMIAEKMTTTEEDVDEQSRRVHLFILSVA